MTKRKRLEPNTVEWAILNVIRKKGPPAAMVEMGPLRVSHRLARAALFVFVVILLGAGASSGVSQNAAESAAEATEATAPKVVLQFRLAEREEAEGLTAAEVPDSGQVVWLHETVELSNEHVAYARAAKQWNGATTVDIQFTDEGRARFAELTRNNVMKMVAILVDGTVLSSPVIREPILGGMAQISGSFDQEEAERIAAGILAAPEGVPRAQPVTPPAPLDMAKATSEVELRYAAAHPEIQEYILWTARTFGRRGMWLNEDALAGLSDAEREKKVVYLARLLEASEYGRHLCRRLAEASALKDERLVPGLLKVAGYHRESGDYDCRPKWIAVSALARQEADQAVPLLISLVDHGNQNTRKWARAALARKTGQDYKEDKRAWATWWEAQGHAPVGERFLLKWGEKESTALLGDTHAAAALVVSARSDGQEASTPDFATVEWETLASATFDNDKPDGTRRIWGVPGIVWDFTNGVARAMGTTQTNQWRSTRISLPADGDIADLVEVSGEFMLPQHEGYHLVALWGQDTGRGKENLCMYFEGKNGIGHYRIQTRWATVPTRLVAGQHATEGFGDETDCFHKMRMILDRTASLIYYYVDDRHLGTVKVDGDVEPIKAVEMDFESPAAGNATEVHYDNLTVRSGIR